VKTLRQVCAKGLGALAVLALSGVPVGGASAQEVSVEAGIGTGWSSNLLTTRTATSDIPVRPHASLGIDFAHIWNLGYEGSAEILPGHMDLTSHSHGLTLSVNPAWGPDGLHEVYVAVAAETLQNGSTYDSLDFAGARLTAAYTQATTAWLEWQIGLDARYRAFYNDPLADSLDVMPRAWARFTLPSRTTLTPRVGYGMRYNAELRGKAVRAVTGRGRGDMIDQQVEIGLHASQGLWETGGLQAGYAWRHLIGTAGVVNVRLTQGQFAFLSTDFLAGGHHAYLRLKQVLPAGFSAVAGLDVRTLEYPGWTATDQLGNALAKDRSDVRLVPSASVAWKRSAGPVELEATAAYGYVRQWSNTWDYDAQGHSVTIDLTARY
jgi:hypothetical protein